MKSYLAIFLGSTAAMDKWRAIEETKRKEMEKAGIAAWMKWATHNAGSIVEMGGPLGKTKKVDAQGIADVRNEMGAFTIVQAESQEAAAKLFLKHPHFTIFPGESIEVMEIMPIPAM